jgi:hypothetical protein
LQKKQGWEKSIRQIQGDNPVEKTRKGEKPKANPGRQPCRENKGMRQPYENKKTWSKPRMKGDDPRFSGGMGPSQEIGRKP